MYILEIAVLSQIFPFELQLETIQLSESNAPEFNRIMHYVAKGNSTHPTTQTQNYTDTHTYVCIISLLIYSQ